MRQKDGVVWIWQAVCQCPAILPCCSRPCFLAAENTIRQSDLCAACQTAKTKYKNYFARDSTLYSKDVLANIYIYPLVDMIYLSIYIIYLVIYVLFFCKSGHSVHAHGRHAKVRDQACFVIVQELSPFALWIGLSKVPPCPCMKFQIRNFFDGARHAEGRDVEKDMGHEREGGREREDKVVVAEKERN
ncbi:hypothetical protein ALC56_13182 [Trachymyrmex septentrionalis]|uniref:Uncharacterized protein n=1 Tax=Trachymyrmex septentrionalis TaxID=34720 RepID=A0A195EVN9_9HYME|nr:hypothetical protein ALC56_13182 [Trachymyrmex septentrionalis]